MSAELNSHRTRFTITHYSMPSAAASKDCVQHGTVLAVTVWVPRASRKARRMLGKRIGTGPRHVRRRLTDLWPRRSRGLSSSIQQKYTPPHSPTPTHGVSMHHIGRWCNKAQYLSIQRQPSKVRRRHGSHSAPIIWYVVVHKLKSITNAAEESVTFKMDLHYSEQAAVTLIKMLCQINSHYQPSASHYKL